MGNHAILMPLGTAIKIIFTDANRNKMRDEIIVDSLHRF